MKIKLTISEAILMFITICVWASLIGYQGGLHANKNNQTIVPKCPPCNPIVLPREPESIFGKPRQIEIDNIEI